MSQRAAFNDSIIMGNVGADGHSNNIELDLAPQDIIDTELVDTPPPKKSRKKLYLALAIAGRARGWLAHAVAVRATHARCARQAG